MLHYHIRYATRHLTTKGKRRARRWPKVNSPNVHVFGGSTIINTVLVPATLEGYGIISSANDAVFYAYIIRRIWSTSSEGYVRYKFQTTCGCIEYNMLKTFLYKKLYVLNLTKTRENHFGSFCFPFYFLSVIATHFWITFIFATSIVRLENRQQANMISSCVQLQIRWKF